MQARPFRETTRRFAMGCNSYTYLKVTVLDKGEDAREEAERFAGESGWYVHGDALGRVVLQA